MAGGHENLIPTSERTKEEVRAIGRKGGIASGEARRKKRTLTDELKILMDQDNNKLKVSTALLTKALDGDTKAIGLLRDTIGEKPRDVIDIHDTRDDKYKDLTVEELKELANK